MYGYGRVKEEFKSSADKSPDEIVEHLKNSASQMGKRIKSPMMILHLLL